jgi:hypothetical protein
MTLDGETKPTQQVPTWGEEPSKDMEHGPPSTENEYQVCDLYAVGRAKTQEANKEEAKPFIHEDQLLGPSREIV